MPVARVYLPAGAAEVAALVQERELASGAAGFVVGPAGTEEQEHAAWLAAAEAAGAAAEASAAGAGARRVVVSADVDVSDVDPAPSAMWRACVVTAPIPLKRIVSFHVDETVGSGVADLLWYDVTELADVAALLTDVP